MAATIHDVAREAGVSKSTVSRVFSSPDQVKADTKEKVHQAAQVLNYTPNALARAMITNKTGNLGLIICDKQKPLLSNPFYGPIIEAIVEEVNRRGYSLFISTDSDITLPSGQLMREKKIDGVILASNIGEEVISSFLDRQIPVVLLNALSEREELCCVINDDYKGARRAVEHLIDQGHKKIGMLSGEFSPYLCKRRHNAFIDAMKEASLEINPRWDLSVSVSKDEIFKTANRLITMRERPTAVFCNSDMVAIPLMKALLRADLKIPEDMAVIGYDDSDYCTVMEPELTSVQIDKETMGRKAVELLNSLIEGKTIEERYFVTDSQLIQRQSG